MCLDWPMHAKVKPFALHTPGKNDWFVIGGLMLHNEINGSIPYLQKFPAAIGIGDESCGGALISV